MDSIKLVSLLADNANFVYRAIAGYISRRAGIAAEFVEDASWLERERMLDAGQAQVGFLCGLPYTHKVDQPNPGIELLAAPVMQGERFQCRPIYFSDVVVHHDSPFRSFADLRGARWAYNDAGSHSGYNVPCYHSALLDKTAGCFGEVIQSGGHQASLRMVLEGTADASAIDSTVLALEYKLHPHLASEVRIIETLGPSRIPPVAVSTDVPATLKQTLREVFLRMHEDEQGRAILESGLILRFVEVHDDDYDEIRRMARVAERVKLA